MTQAVSTEFDFSNPKNFQNPEKETTPVVKTNKFNKISLKTLPKHVIVGGGIAASLLLSIGGYQLYEHVMDERVKENTVLMQSTNLNEVISVLTTEKSNLESIYKKSTETSSEFSKYSDVITTLNLGEDISRKTSSTKSIYTSINDKLTQDSIVLNKIYNPKLSKEQLKEELKDSGDFSILSKYVLAKNAKQAVYTSELEKSQLELEKSLNKVIEIQHEVVDKVDENIKNQNLNPSIIATATDGLRADLRSRADRDMSDILSDINSISSINSEIHHLRYSSGVNFYTSAIDLLNATNAINNLKNASDNEANIVNQNLNQKLSRISSKQSSSFADYFTLYSLLTSKYTHLVNPPSSIQETLKENNFFNFNNRNSGFRMQLQNSTSYQNAKYSVNNIKDNIDTELTTQRNYLSDIQDRIEREEREMRQHNEQVYHSHTSSSTPIVIPVPIPVGGSNTTIVHHTTVSPPVVTNSTTYSSPNVSKTQSDTSAKDFSVKKTETVNSNPKPSEVNFNKTISNINIRKSELDKLSDKGTSFRTSSSSSSFKRK
jgi:hypothetical protein